MASTLLGGIFDLFTSDAALSGLVPDSPFLDEVPDTRDVPFVVIANHSEAPGRFDYEGGFEEFSAFDFIAYQIGLEDAEAIGTAIKNAFDEADLPVAGALDLRTRRLDYRVRLIPTRNENARRIYEVSIPYVAIYRKRI